MNFAWKKCFKMYFSQKQEKQEWLMNNFSTYFPCPSTDRCVKSIPKYLLEIQ